MGDINFSNPKIKLPGDVMESTAEAIRREIGG
jgi:hypothetical protein